MEAPHLSTFSKRYRDDGLVVLAINADNFPEARIAAFASQMNLAQHVMVMGEDIAGDYSIVRWPSSVYIDRKGNIVDHDFDYASPQQMEAKIKTLLASRP